MPGLSLLLVASLAAGCAHSGKNATGRLAVEPVPQPPVFLTGPMALLLTNVGGFRARVVLEDGAPARQLAAGELMGRGGLRVGELLRLTPRDVEDQKLILRSPKSGKELEIVLKPCALHDIC